MKFYTLTGNLAGQAISVDKKFESRQKAMDYMFHLARKKLIFNLEVEDIELIDNNKHNLEYVCNNDNFFTIKRIYA